jgi:hypothetical protein
MSKEKIVWKKKSRSKDYDAALKYLSLIFPIATAERLVQALHKASLIEYAAKDLLRGSSLPVLPRDEAQVDEDLRRIHKGKALVPVLLIRGGIYKGVPLILADGYHRICAICYYEERAPLVCRLVNMRGGK